MPSGRGGKDFYLFARRVKRYAQDVPRAANEYKKACAEEALRQIIADCPVDTGKARDNFFAAIGRGTRGPFREAPYSREGARSLSEAVPVIDGAQPGQRISLFNNTAHIARLNEGWSPQAAPGFVETAVGRAKLTVARQMYKAFRMP